MKSTSRMQHPLNQITPLEIMIVLVLKKTFNCFLSFYNSTLCDLDLASFIAIFLKQSRQRHLLGTPRL